MKLGFLFCVLSDEISINTYTLYIYMYIGYPRVWLSIGGCVFFGQSELLMKCITFLFVQSEEPTLVYFGG